MSVSIPSKQIYSVDVPEVENFNVKFVYNYFVPDEQVNDNVIVPKFFSRKSTEEINSSYKKIFDTKVPRYVSLSWSKTIATVDAKTSKGDSSLSLDQNDIPKNFIKDNYDKVITEEEFSSNNFVGITWHDSQLYNKLQTMLESATEVFGEIPKDDPDYELMANDPSSFSTKYYKSGLQNDVGVTRDLNELLGSVYVNTQINKRYLYDIVNRVIQDPHSPYADDLTPLLDYGKKYKDMTEDKAIEEDYNPSFPYVRISPVKDNYNSKFEIDLKVVGYVIDKFYVDDDKQLITCPPIIVEDSALTQYIDTKIFYNKTYCYSIRSICAINVPAIDQENGKISLATFLISSKSSRKLWFASLENKAPPYPADTRFLWDYGTEKLHISWCHPVNPQYDIKKFQVFRRKKIEHPFQILKEYDFDNSVIKMEDGEKPQQSVIEYVDYPKTYFIDDDFNKNSKFIYTLACVDAHGITSNYGPQYEVSFDKFKNELIINFISYPGAPKPYPNLYLEGTGFTNVIKVGGQYSKTMSVFLAPHSPGRRYFFINDGKKIKNIFETDITKGSYKLQIINLDNQKGETVTIEVEDRVSKWQEDMQNESETETKPKKDKSDELKTKYGFG